MNRIQRNWVGTAIVVIVVTLIVLYFKNRPRENSDLTLQRKVDSIGTQIAFRELKIDSLSYISAVYKDSVSDLKMVIKQLEVDYDKLVDQKKIALSQDIPIDSTYTLLTTVIYPDKDTIKPYPFTMKQVKSIYMTSIESEYLNGQVVLLEGRLAHSARQIALQDSIIISSEGIINNYEFLAGNYRETISLKDEQIIYRDKKIRRLKIGGVVVGVGALLLGGLIGGN